MDEAAARFSKLQLKPEDSLRAEDVTRISPQFEVPNWAIGLFGGLSEAKRCRTGSTPAKPLSTIVPNTVFAFAEDTLVPANPAENNEMPAELRPYFEFTRFDDGLMLQRSIEFRQHMLTRRTVREFSPQEVDQEIIDNCLQVAASAPSGANFQPWTFVVVESPEIRRAIRNAAESEERAFYHGRAPDEWLNAVAPLGTDASKPFLELAPILICIFAQSWRPTPDNSRGKNYYVAESVGIATGFLISALHHAGLATLTHTPSPMNFLNSILGRPDNERPFLILVAGFPVENCAVPLISRKPLSEVVVRL